MSDKTLNVKEAAILLRMSRNTLSKRLKEGNINLPYIRTARKYYIKESDVLAFLRSNTYIPKPKDSLEIG